MLSAVPWGELAKLTPSDGESDDFLSASVSVSDNRETVLFAVPWDDDRGLNMGAVYVYRWDATSMSYLETKLISPVFNRFSMFGASVSVSGNGESFVVGESGLNGRAYVYQWDATSMSYRTTETLAKFRGSFGSSVSISTDGETVVVGAPGSPAPAAYVYQWDAASMSYLETKLTASDGEGESNRFGNSVSVTDDGETVVVGAFRDDDNGNQSGSAYVYQWDATSMSYLETKLTASDGAEEDSFGHRVSVSGDGETVAVGAVRDGNITGSAYVYQWDAISMSYLETKLTASDGAEDDQFGVSVSVSDDGETVVVGSRLDDDRGFNSGSAYVYQWDATSMSYLETKLTASAAGGNAFGASVSISGDGETLVVGALHDDNDAFSGAAYLFVPDAIAPETTIDSATDGNALPVTDGGSTLSDSIALGFSMTDNLPVGRFECSLDGGAYAPCSSPHTYADLAIGAHTVEVRAIDSAGNVDQTPASFSWTIITPIQAIDTVITDVEDLAIDSNVENGVINKLVQAQTAIDRGKLGVAENKLNDVIRQISANKKIEEDDKADLIDDIQLIIDALGV